MSDGGGEGGMQWACDHHNYPTNGISLLDSPSSSFSAMVKVSLLKGSKSALLSLADPEGVTPKVALSLISSSSRATAKTRRADSRRLSPLESRNERRTSVACGRRGKGRKKWG